MRHAPNPGVFAVCILQYRGRSVAHTNIVSGVEQIASNRKQVLQQGGGKLKFKRRLTEDSDKCKTGLQSFSYVR